MFIRKSTHDAIVAQKDAEIARINLRCDAARDRSNHNCQAATKSALLAADRAKQICALEARLAVFTAPRARGPKGHFLPTRPADAPVKGAR